MCSEVQEDDDETVGMIKELLDTRIRYVEDSCFFCFHLEGGGREEHPVFYVYFTTQTKT